MDGRHERSPKVNLKRVDRPLLVGCGTGHKLLPLNDTKKDVSNSTDLFVRLKHADSAGGVVGAWVGTVGSLLH